MKQVLIEQRRILNKIQKNKQEKENIYKEDHVIFQSFNQRSFSKKYHVIVKGNDVEQMELQRGTNV